MRVKRDRERGMVINFQSKERRRRRCQCSDDFYVVWCKEKKRCLWWLVAIDLSLESLFFSLDEELFSTAGTHSPFATRWSWIIFLRAFAYAASIAVAHRLFVVMFNFFCFAVFKKFMYKQQGWTPDWHGTQDSDLSWSIVMELTNNNYYEELARNVEKRVFVRPVSTPETFCQGVTSSTCSSFFRQEDTTMLSVCRRLVGTWGEQGRKEGRNNTGKHYQVLHQAFYKHPNRPIMLRHTQLPGMHATIQLKCN